MRILVVEDDADVASIVKLVLVIEGHAVDIAPNGEQGWELADVYGYDVVVLDRVLPDMDGLDVCRLLRPARPETFVMVMSGRDQIQDRLDGLNAGADDYLVKPFDLRELVARVHALLRRDVRARQVTLEFGGIRLDPLRRLVAGPGGDIALTRKEFALLELLMRHAGEVVSQETLLEHVWDGSVNELTNTVRVHVASLRRKLGAAQTVNACIETEAGVGYALCPRSAAGCMPRSHERHAPARV